jgi:hypothetical protein
LEIHIGHSEHEFILLDITNRSHPDDNDYSDGNWLNAKVFVKVGCFNAEVDGQLRADELASFRDELTKLYRSLSGCAKFSTMEGWLSFEITGDGKGHFSCIGKVADEFGHGNILKFKLYFDQTFMPEILNGLEKVTKAFPVLGKTQTTR